MKTLFVLAALSSLATLAASSARAEDILIVQPTTDYVAGCQVNFDHIGQSLPCTDGSMITLEVGNDHKAHVIRHSSAGMPGVQTAPPAASSAYADAPPVRESSYVQPPSRGCPAPAEPIGPGEEWKCGVKHDDGLTMGIVVHAGTNTPASCTIHYYRYTGMGWEPHGTSRFAMCQDRPGQSRSYGTQYASTSALTRPSTQEAAVSVVYDAQGRVTTVRQEVRDPVAPKVIGGIALALGLGVAERIACGHRDWCY
jgi:hypothetical protein